MDAANPLLLVGAAHHTAVPKRGKAHLQRDLAMPVLGYGLCDPFAFDLALTLGERNLIDSLWPRFEANASSSASETRFPGLC